MKNLKKQLEDLGWKIEHRLIKHPNNSWLSFFYPKSEISIEYSVVSDLSFSEGWVSKKHLKLIFEYIDLLPSYSQKELEELLKKYPEGFVYGIQVKGDE